MSEADDRDKTTSIDKCQKKGVVGIANKCSALCRMGPCVVLYSCIAVNINPVLSSVDVPCVPLTL